MKKIFALFAFTVLYTTQLSAQQNEPCVRCDIVAAITEGAIKACPRHVKIRDAEAKKTYDTFKKAASPEKHAKMMNSTAEYHSKPGKCDELARDVRAANDGTGGSFGRNYALLAAL
jgi:hypothetical protein